MLVERSLVEKFIKMRFNKYVKDDAYFWEMFEYLSEKYDMSGDVFSDYYSGRSDVSRATDFELYVLLDAIQTFGSLANRIPKWFTEREINLYKISRFEKEHKTELPIQFNMFQVNIDQWIGVTDTNEINKLRKAELINYNPETQRTMQRIVRHGIESFIITVNKAAVKIIRKLFKTEIYIPTTITLNIPNDINNPADFSYDEENHKLIVKNIKYFDITDGYHRYLAMIQEKILNPDFNYPMELRITNFDVEKAQRFIYQEDQKTQMKKNDSNSFNTFDPANVVVTKLNESSMCNVRGMISRNDGLINFGKLSELVRNLYFKGVGKKEERITILNVTKELTDDFNILTEADPEFIERKYTNADICIIVTLFHYYSDKDKREMVDGIKYVIDHVDDFKNKNIFSNNFNSRVAKQIIEKNLERSQDYV